jgi:hypothetical protein
MAQLLPQAVETLFQTCQFRSGDSRAEQMEVQAIVHRFYFHRGRLRAHEAQIVELLGELPVEFHRSGGGGYTFLNGCLDKQGRQWTGMQSTVELLIALGIGAGKVEFLIPREQWAALPGGVPYIVVDV